LKPTPHVERSGAALDIREPILESLYTTEAVEKEDEQVTADLGRRGCRPVVRPKELAATADAAPIQRSLRVGTPPASIVAAIVARGRKLDACRLDVTAQV